MSKLGFVFAVALLGACGSSTPSTSTTPTAPTAPAASLCPMDVPGTSVAAVDTATGGALVFRTTGDAAALTDRVAGWAQRHNARHGAMGPLPTGAETGGGGHDHHHHHDHGGGGDTAASATATDPGGDPAAMVSTHTRAEMTTVDGSVQLGFVAFPDQVGALQGELRAHAEHLTAAGCGGS